MNGDRRWYQVRAEHLAKLRQVSEKPEFEITIRVRPYGSTEWAESALVPQMVQAWDLYEALTEAQSIPLHQWFEDES